MHRSTSAVRPRLRGKRGQIGFDIGNRRLLLQRHRRAHAIAMLEIVAAVVLTLPRRARLHAERSLRVVVVALALEASRRRALVAPRAIARRLARRIAVRRIAEPMLAMRAREEDDGREEGEAKKRRRSHGLQACTFAVEVHNACPLN